jgi:acyl transferase domain-containing protein
VRSSASTDVAIIGMACVFPGARDLDAFWENLQAGRDAIGDAPAGRIEPLFFEPAAGELDRLYCRRGGFIGETLEFDPCAGGSCRSPPAAASPISSCRSRPPPRR